MEGVLDLQNNQKQTLNAILALNQENATTSGGNKASLNTVERERPAWKVLIYDETCKNIIAPLLKVGNLRSFNVTLFLDLKEKRDRVNDMVAIYLVEPTKSNLDTIIQDCVDDLYHQAYINFAHPISKELLEEFASMAVRRNCIKKIAKIHDHYLKYIALEPTLFTLNHRFSYRLLHEQNDEVMSSSFDRIAEGVFNMLVHNNFLPVFRYQKEDSTGYLADKLNQKFQDYFSSSAVEMSGRILTKINFLLLDRNVDLTSLISHTWKYQPMVHDLLGINLNRVHVPSSSGDTHFDLDITHDKFWANHVSQDLLPEVGQNINHEVETLKAEKDKLDEESKKADLSEKSARLSSALSSFAEMSDRRHRIDMHVSIATNMIEDAEKRRVHDYYTIENMLIHSKSLKKADREKFLSLLESGSESDNLRLLMIYYLTLDTNAKPDESIEKFVETNPNINTALLNHVKNLRSINSGANDDKASRTSGGMGMGGFISGFATSMKSHGKGLLSGMQHLMPNDTNLMVTKILEEVLENKKSAENSSLATTDTVELLKQNVSAFKMPRVENSQDTILFVIGGTNYNEVLNVKEYGKKMGRRIICGSTEIINPVDFVEEVDSIIN